MIATPSINKPLSSCYGKGGFVIWLEGETLGEVLKTVRKDWGRSTPGYLSQLKMAKALEKKHGDYAPSQGFISNIENDLNPIQDLHEEVRFDLLRLYPLSEEQIAELDRRFELKLSRGSHVNNPLVESLSNFGSVDEVSIKSWGNPHEEGYALPHTLLGHHRPADCFTIVVEGGVLASDEARRLFVNGLRLFFDESIVPKTGDTVAYKVAGQERYIITTYQEPLPPRALTSYDGKEVLTTPAGGEGLELLGVLWWYWPPQGRTSERKTAHSA